MEDKVIKAMDAACRWHEGQRYGEFPYVRHLAHVALVCAEFGFTDSDYIAAAWLHDSIEDAAVLRATLGREFGDRVAALVSAVTDGKGRNRAERHEQSFTRMLEYPDAIILKLADRIANVESSIVSSNNLLRMYAKEYPEFRERLYAASLRIDGCRTRIAAMWSYLHELIPSDSEVVNTD